jgi:uncharacterized protein (DUF1778 family)
VPLGARESAAVGAYVWLTAWPQTQSYVQSAYADIVVVKSARLNLRLTPAQDTVLRRAAEALGEPVSDYVLRHAVEAAEADLADRRVFVVDDTAWHELERLLDRPPRPAVKLRRLLEEPSILDPR